MTAKPLVLLDMDGVVNDLQALDVLLPLGPDSPQVAQNLGVTLMHSYGFPLAIPYYMPELIQELAVRAEIWWCTTWREAANDDIAGHLGVGPFPVIDREGYDLSGLDWKIRNVRPLVERAQRRGRKVIWIEDFDGDLPDLDGIVYIDTGERERLQPSDIPLDVFE